MRTRTARPYFPPMRQTPNQSRELTRSLTSLWTEYAGKCPGDTRTEIRGNVVTCTLVDAVGPFNHRMNAPQAHDTVRGVGRLTEATYKQEAVAAVGRVMRQRVASFVSSHDRDTDVATEVFTLEPSLSRGAPPRSAAASSLSAPPRRRPALSS
jgi:uncharacterized protein YbcI